MIERLGKQKSLIQFGGRRSPNPRLQFGEHRGVSWPGIDNRLFVSKYQLELPKIKRILRKHGYPPDKQERATQTVLQQAELICRDWAG